MSSYAPSWGELGVTHTASSWFCRIDRMAMILVYEFFPYYRYWRDRKLSKSSLERIKIIEAGHRLWESGAVESLGPRKFRIWTTRKVEEIHLSAVQDDGDP